MQHPRGEAKRKKLGAQWMIVGEGGAGRDMRIVDANAIRAVIGDQTVDDLAEAAE
jgi:hypothetical protein